MTTTYTAEAVRQPDGSYRAVAAATHDPPIDGVFGVSQESDGFRNYLSAYIRARIMLRGIRRREREWVSQSKG